jgi:hypothetical protein
LSSPDGRIDYSNYSEDEIRQVLAHVDAERYPINVANAKARLDALASGGSTVTIPPEQVLFREHRVYPSLADQPQVAMTWLRGLKFYWAVYWRGLLAFAGLMVGFVVVYGVLSALLLHSPLFERAVRLVLIVALLLFSLGWGTSRALQVGFSDFAIIARRPSVEGPVPVTLWLGVSLFWSSAWRVLLISTPVNLALTYAILGRLVVGSIQENLMVSALTWPISIAVHVWAFRVALKLDYGDVSFAPVSLPGSPLDDPRMKK